MPTATAGTTSYAYDRADRILSSGSVSDTADANGNLTARGSDSFTYDQASRLTSATVNGTTTTYSYDGDGKRASQTIGGATTSYVYDVNASLPNVLTDGTRKDVYGLGLAYAVDDGGNVQVYHTDGLGSVRAITDGAGQAVQTYQTDPFDVPTETQGTSSQPFQFTGQQHDGNGLVYLRARMYDPTIGRFLQRDPLFGSPGRPLTLNHYGYARNNPLFLVDPSGFSANRVTQDPCSDPTSLLHWFCGDNMTRLYPFGMLRMTPFDRDILGALEGAAGGDDIRYATGGSGAQASETTTASKSTHLWPETAEEMDAFLGFEGSHVPDSPNTPGRKKVVWELPGKMKITYEQHPYDTGAPEWHRNPHWHLDTPGVPHKRYLPGEQIPGF